MCLSELAALQTRAAGPDSSFADMAADVDDYTAPHSLRIDTDFADFDDAGDDDTADVADDDTDASEVHLSGMCSYCYNHAMATSCHGCSYYAVGGTEAAAPPVGECTIDVFVGTGCVTDSRRWTGQQLCRHGR